MKYRRPSIFHITGLACAQMYSDLASSNTSWSESTFSLTQLRPFKYVDCGSLVCLTIILFRPEVLAFPLPSEQGSSSVWMHHLVLSRSKVRLGFSVCYQAKPAQLKLFGLSHLKEKPACYTLAWMK